MGTSFEMYIGSSKNTPNCLEQRSWNVLEKEFEEELEIAIRSEACKKQGEDMRQRLEVSLDAQESEKNELRAAIASAKAEAAKARQVWDDVAKLEQELQETFRRDGFDDNEPKFICSSPSRELPSSVSSPCEKVSRSISSSGVSSPLRWPGIDHCAVIPDLSGSKLIDQGLIDSGVRNALPVVDQSSPNVNNKLPHRNYAGRLPGLDETVNVVRDFPSHSSFGNLGVHENREKSEIFPIPAGFESVEVREDVLLGFQGAQGQ